jgi:hypothetical protein
MYLRNRSANAELRKEMSSLYDCNLVVPKGFPSHNIVIMLSLLKLIKLIYTIKLLLSVT